MFRLVTLRVKVVQAYHGNKADLPISMAHIPKTTSDMRSYSGPDGHLPVPVPTSRIFDGFGPIGAR